MAKKHTKKKGIDRKLLLGGILAAVLLGIGFLVVWRWISDNRLPNFRKEAAC